MDSVCLWECVHVWACIFLCASVCGMQRLRGHTLLHLCVSSILTHVKNLSKIKPYFVHCSFINCAGLHYLNNQNIRELNRSLTFFILIIFIFLMMQGIFVLMSAASIYLKWLLLPEFSVFSLSFPPITYRWPCRTAAMALVLLVSIGTCLVQVFIFGSYLDKFDKW